MNAYAFKAVAILTVFVSFNLFSFIAYYKCLIQNSESIQLPLILQIFIILSIFSLLNFFFVVNEKYKLIVEKISNNERWKGKNGTVAVMSYMILTILFLLSIIKLKCT